MTSDVVPAAQGTQVGEVVAPSLVTALDVIYLEPPCTVGVGPLAAVSVTSLDGFDDAAPCPCAPRSTEG